MEADYAWVCLAGLKSVVRSWPSFESSVEEFIAACICHTLVCGVWGRKEDGPMGDIVVLHPLLKDHIFLCDQKFSRNMLTVLKKF